MKVAISLPDDLARQVDLCARRLRVPRSRLLADGARLVLARYRLADATEAWNTALGGTTPEDARVEDRLRERSKRVVRSAGGRWRR